MKLKHRKKQGETTQSKGEREGEEKEGKKREKG